MGAGLPACRQDGGIAPTDPTSTVRDTTGSILLFTGTSGVTDTGTPSFESGMEKSASGTINPELFTEAKNPFRTKGARLTLNLFENTIFIAVIESTRTLGPSRYTATGHIEGLAGSGFIATAENTTLSALVTMPDAAVYRVEYAGDNRYRAVLQNGSAPACPPAMVPDSAPGPLASPAPPAPLPPLQKAAAAGPLVLDIAIVYTDAALKGARSVAAMNTLIDQAVAQANQAFASSKIGVSLNLVYRGQVAYAETGRLQTDLARLQEPKDTFLNEVHAIRDNYGADLVSMITETGETAPTGIAQAYVMTSVNPFHGAYAFSVIRRAYLSGFGALAHEVGHNLGCQHDWNHAQNMGAFTYSYGHRWKGDNGVEYRDLMAFAPGTMINQFSNPEVAFKGGLTGAGTANSARTILNTAPTVAAYRGHKELRVDLTSPTVADTLRAPANVILNATASGSLAISKVEFYHGSALLGSDATEPYSWSWNPVAAGTYTVSAKVHTKAGTTAESSPVTFSCGTTFVYGSTWNDVHVGTSGVAGKVSMVYGERPVWTVTSTGPGIAGKADNFQFLHASSHPGDVEIRAGIESLGNTDSGALAGVMIRESLLPGARFVFLGRNPAGGLRLLKRTALNGAIVTIKPPSSRPPAYIQLVRKAGQCVAYISDGSVSEEIDVGKSWTELSAHAFAMNAEVFAGAAVTSNSLTRPVTAVFGYLEANWKDVNQPPTALITSPLSGTTFNPGTAITFKTTATDRDGLGTLGAMEYINDAARFPERDALNLIGTVPTAPYTLAWKTVSGVARIKARLTDNRDYAAYSNEVVLKIMGAGEYMSASAADAHVRDGSSATKNFGATINLMVRNSSTAGESYESYLKFPIDSLDAVAGATLRLYGNVTGGTGAVTVEVSPCADADWLESGTKAGFTTLTWNSKPARGGTIASKAIADATLQWHEFDVSEYVKARKAEGAKLVAFALRGASATAGYASFGSRTALSGKPELVLTDGK
jgi:hypothetical protein